MTIQNPSWKVKTRPCPFYSQGRCLFADSCNFLHTIFIESTPESTLVNDTSASPQGEQEVVLEHGTPTTSPLSPSLSSPRSARSQNRSPRLTSLLLALRDVIGDDESDKEAGSDREGEAGEMKLQEEWDLEKQVGTFTNGPDRTPEPKHISTIETTSHDRQTSEDVDVDDHSIYFAGLLSPVNVSQLPRVPFVQNLESVDGISESEAWNTPRPFIISPPRSRLSSSTFDLLGSPFGEPSTRVLSPRLSAPILPASRAGTDPGTPIFNASFELRSELEDVIVDFSNDIHDRGPGVSGDKEGPKSIYELFPGEDRQLMNGLACSQNSSLRITLPNEILKNMESDPKAKKFTEQTSVHRMPQTPGSLRVIYNADPYSKPIPTPGRFLANVVSKIKQRQYETDSYRENILGYDTAEGEIGINGDESEGDDTSSSSIPQDGTAKSESSSNEEAFAEVVDLDNHEAWKENSPSNRTSRLPLPPNLPGFIESAVATIKQELRLPPGEVMLSRPPLFSMSSSQSSPGTSNPQQAPNDLDLAYLDSPASHNFPRLPKSSVQVEDKCTSDSEHGIDNPGESFASEPSHSSKPQDDSGPENISQGLSENDTLASLYSNYSALPTPVTGVSDVFKADLLETLFSNRKPSLVLAEEHGRAIYDSPGNTQPLVLKPAGPSGTNLASGYYSNPSSRSINDENLEAGSRDSHGITPEGTPHELQILPRSPLRENSRSTSLTTDSSNGADDVASSSQDRPPSTASSLESPYLLEKMSAPPFSSTSWRERSKDSGSPKSSSPLGSQLHKHSPDLNLSPKARGKQPARMSDVSGSESHSSSKIPSHLLNSTVMVSNTHLPDDTDQRVKRNSQVLHPRLQTEFRTTTPATSEQCVSATSSSRLRPLRLSSVLGAGSFSSSDTSAVGSANFDRIDRRVSQSPVTSSVVSSSANSKTSSPQSFVIPTHTRDTHELSLSSANNLVSPRSAPLATSWRFRARAGTGLSYKHPRAPSQISEPNWPLDEESDETFEKTIRRINPELPHTAPAFRSASGTSQGSQVAATPPPNLMFAIASDDVGQVRRVLESGEAGANDQVGPQSALAFALTNDQLENKISIVKTLLSYGADTSVLKNPDTQLPGEEGTTIFDKLDPATRYLISRADSLHAQDASALIHKSFFRPLTKVRFELIGQDRALEQLFRVLSMHSQKHSMSPIVIMLCGPSGHGKSLLARQFGHLLDVPTHTVNMTTLQATHDLWKSYSMSPYEEPSTCTLAEFLIQNEGQRCVVVLDEIEKTENEKTLWALLMPWELGRCSLEAGRRHIDVRNVIWLGTSNVGHELVFSHHASRKHPEDLMTREEYLELIRLLRPRVLNSLGASLLSRVTAVLPFVPFLPEEKRAVATEALYSQGGETARAMTIDVLEATVSRAVLEYLPAEGARSLYRAISNQLVDTL